MDHLEPTLISRIYNGLDHRDQRKGYPVIVLTKPVTPVVAPKKSWWRKVLGL